MNRNERSAVRVALEGALQDRRPQPERPAHVSRPRETVGIDVELLESAVTALRAHEDDIETVVGAGLRLEALEQENARLREVLEGAESRLEAAIDQAFERRTREHLAALNAAGQALDDRERAIEARERQVGIPPPVTFLSPEEVFERVADERRAAAEDRARVRGLILPL